MARFGRSADEKNSYMQRKNLILLSFLSVVLLLSSGCEEEKEGCMEAQAPNFENSATQECNKCCEKHIDYKVTGSADTVTVIYKNASGSKQKEEMVEPNWKKRIQVQVEEDVYLEARSEVSNGSIRVQIFHNNDLLKEEYDNSNFATGTVSGMVPNYQ